ncbi:MAG: VCBS repeat-containing protein, partial [Acidobacteria bacterium]
MTIEITSSSRRLPPLLLAGLLAGFVCGAAAAQFRDADTPQQGRPEIPDVIGEWQTTDEGQEFRIVKLHKPSRIEGRDWIRDPEKENVVRGHMGMPIEFFHEDDEYFWVREFKPQKFEAQPDRPQRTTLPEAPGDPVPAQWRIAFENRSKGLPNSQLWRNGVVFHDMNGDGRLDLVHGPPRKGDGRPRVFLQNEDRSWQEWELRLPELALDYGDVDAGDFDGDGHADIALGMHLRGGTVLLGDGTGAFRLGGDGIEYRANMNRPAWTGRALVAADLDRDGDLDLAYIGEGMEPPGLREEGTRKLGGSKGLMLYMNESPPRSEVTKGAKKARKRGAEGGDAPVQPLSWSRVPLGSEAYGDSIEVGDLEADGVLEIAHANNVARGPTVLWAFDEEAGSYVTVPLTSILPGSITRSVAFGDIDGKPGDELVTAGLGRDQSGWSLDIRWHKRDAEGNWTATEIHREARNATIYGLATGDLDGGGVTDVVA